MVYTKTAWQDQPSTATPLSAANLNHAETQYDEAAAYTDAAIAGVPTKAYIDAGDAAAVPKALVDAKGDVLAGTGADALARVAVGSDGQVLTADAAAAAGVKWATPAAGGSGIPPTLIDAKGDLIAGSANDTAARVAVGSDGQVLTADAASAAGVKWATPSAGGGGVAAPASGTRIPLIASDAANTAQLQAGWLNMIPVWVPVAITINSVSLEVIGGGAAPSTVKLGLYSVAVVGGAGTLYRDFGTITTETTGLKSASGGPWAIAPGVYYFAALAGGTAATLRAGGNRPGGPMQALPIGGSIALGRRYLDDPGGTVLPPTSAASPSPNGGEGVAMVAAIIGVIA